MVFSCLLCLCSLIISKCCRLPFFFLIFVGKKKVVFYTCYHSIAWMLFIPLVPQPYPVIYPTSWSTSPLNPRWVTFNKVDWVILESCCQECGVYFMYNFNETGLLLVCKNQFKCVLTVVSPDTQKKKSRDKAEITFSSPFLVCCLLHMA